MKKLTIGILGNYQNGKSTLVNCLVEKDVAKTGGKGKSVTSINTTYVYGRDNIVSYYNDENCILKLNLEEAKNKGVPENTNKICVSMESEILKKVNFVDTPGFDASDKDDYMAFTSFGDIDAAILLIKNKSLNKVEKNIARQLNEHRIPFFIIMNCMDEGDDMWDPVSHNNSLISAEILADLQINHISVLPFVSNAIWNVNLLWYWHSIMIRNDSDFAKKQNSRISFFFDCFFNNNLPSKAVLKTKSNFTNLSKAMQDEKSWISYQLMSMFGEILKVNNIRTKRILKNYISNYANNHDQLIEDYKTQKDILECELQKIKKTVIEENDKIEEITNRSAFDFSSGTLTSILVGGVFNFMRDQIQKHAARATIDDLTDKQKTIETRLLTNKDLLAFLCRI